MSGKRIIKRIVRTLTIDPKLLLALDEVATAIDVSRSELMNRILIGGLNDHYRSRLSPENRKVIEAMYLLQDKPHAS